MSSDERRDSFEPGGAQGRIRTALDEIIPSPPPVSAVIRKGKRIRVRRRVGVAAGLAVAAVAVAVAPSLMHDTGRHSLPVPLREPVKVTIQRVGPQGPPGLIAKGTIKDRAWTIRLRQMGGRLCIEASGSPRIACQKPADYRASGEPVSLEGSGDSSHYYLAGPVASQVTEVRFVLSDGIVLRLDPVRYGPRRWIGAELPARFPVVEATVYSANGELRHAVPFYDSPASVPIFVAWQRPGQTGQPRITRRIGSGGSAGTRWSVTEHTGPWGYCVTVLLAGQSQGTECTARFSRQGGEMASSSHSAATTGRLPWWFVGAVPNSVSYLRFAISDGRAMRVPVPAVAAGRESFYAFALGVHNLRVLHWDTYDSSGHRASGGRGLP